MNTQVLKHSCPQDWGHPQLQQHFSQNPTYYSYNKYSTQQPNLHQCYFTPIPHIILNVTPSSTLTLLSLKFTREATIAPLGTRPTGIRYSNIVPSPILTPRKTPTDDPSTILPTQLYPSIYFLRSSTPHMTYIPLWFPTPIMAHAHMPIHFPHKWL